MICQFAKFFLYMLYAIETHGASHISTNETEPYSSSLYMMSFLQGTHKSLKGNQKAKATVSAIIDGTGSIGLFDASDK